jgi:DNA-binding response OmpR family regulator
MAHAGGSVSEFKSLVIVEDDMEILRLLITVAKSIGLRVSAIAEDGAEALSVIKSYKPDLVWIDLQLPEVSGIGLLCHYGRTLRR